MSETRIQDRFIDGSYATDPEAEILPGQHQMFHDAFHFVDGVKYPLSLAHHSIPQDGDQIGMIGCRVVRGGSFSPDRSPEEVHRRRCSNLFGCMPFKDDRRLFVPDERGRSYRTALNFRDENEFREAVSKLSADFGHKALHVLDAGCGVGAAFRDLLELDEIDAEKSVGFTLPTIVRRKLNPKLLYADVMHCGMKRRFDMVFSVRGAFHYHPTNMYSQKKTGMLSILQSIDLTQEGGLLLNDLIGYQKKELVERGILVEAKSSGGRFFLRTPAVRVLRHPTVDEVMELMVR